MLLFLSNQGLLLLYIKHLIYYQITTYNYQYLMEGIFLKIVISGFYGLRNTGDEAILEAIIYQLRQQFTNPDITVLSLSPEETSQTHHVHSIYRGWRRQNKEKVKAIKEADVVLSGGGGLLQDTYPTKFLFGPLPYYLLIVLLAKLLRTPVMFISQGIGPVTSRWGKFLMWAIANRADFITVRDQFSKDYLEKLRVTRPPTIVTADVVFALPIPTAYSKIRKDLGLEENEQYITIAPRPWFEHEASYVQKIATATDHLVENEKVTPVFVIMEEPADRVITEQILSKMKHRSRTHVISEGYTPSEIASFIGQSELVISLRLHALIFAARSGVPHIGLSYDPKVEAFLKRSGMWTYSFSLDTIDESALIENAQHLIQQKKNFTTDIKNNTLLLESEAIRNFTLLQQHFFLEKEREELE